MIDTHTHLDDERFPDREEIIAALPQNGVEFVINNSCNFSTMHSGLRLAKDHRRVFCTVGCHPEDAAAFDDAFAAEMVRLAAEKKVLAVGEIGLDYHYEPFEKTVQQKAFVWQLHLAHELHLPVNIHLRDAYGDMADVLTANRTLLADGGVMHCYAGSVEYARRMLDLGFSFAFGGVITFPNARKEEVVRFLPADRILTETDGPYLAPVPVRGSVNVPQNVRYVLAAMARMRGTSAEQLEAQIRENVFRLYPKLQPYREELRL